MNKIIYSPHTDDAIFSLGAYIYAHRDFKIVSPMAGIPIDEAGFEKHCILRQEHAIACKTIGIKPDDVINGNFLDDVYEAPLRKDVVDWIKKTMDNISEIYIPVGIHHPDHLLISNLLIDIICQHDINLKHIYFYEELPYRILYTHLANARVAYLENRIGKLELVEEINSNEVKEIAVRQYVSQTTSDELLKQVLSREKIWKVVR